MASTPSRRCVVMWRQRRRSRHSASSAVPSPFPIQSWPPGNTAWDGSSPGPRTRARAGQINGLGTDDFSRFWGQAVAWSINAGANKNLETRVLLENERARIVVDARDDEGQFLDGLLLSGAILNPGGDSRRVPLQQTAPGRYETTFTPQNEGAYFLTISGEATLADGPTALSDLKGWVMSYSPEYIPRPHDDGTLGGNR